MATGESSIFRKTCTQRLGLQRSQNGRIVAVAVTYPSLLARTRVVSSTFPVNENLPAASEVAEIPACGPSSSSTLAPASGLSALSETVPAINSPLTDPGMLGAV